MKFRSFIWISALALVILALVQYYFITETFRTKQEQFDSKYSGLARLALYEFENRYVDAVQDSLLYTLDDFSYFTMHDVNFSEGENGNDSIYSAILKEFIRQLNRPLVRDYYIEQYFASEGEDSIFITTCDLRSLALIGYGKEHLIPVDSSFKKNMIPEDAYLLNTYTVERNYFRLKYDYYISFPHRSARIRHEMLLTIGLSIITLIIVFGVFFLTLRNLLIQKRLSEMKTDFINNMTHELKTPLSTISVASSSLARGKKDLSDARILEVSDIIKKQNKHLSRLIDRILDITIWEKGQVRIERKQLLVRPFIEEVLSDFRTAHPEISLEADLSGIGKDCIISMDEVHITTVLNNLLSNAVKYGGDPVHVSVKVQCSDSLIVVVRDNGGGIPEDEQKQIFDKFYRGKESKKHAIRGLGLGLYYVKQIVEAHQGKIRLVASDENGSVFNFEIPGT